MGIAGVTPTMRSLARASSNKVWPKTSWNLGGSPSSSHFTISPVSGSKQPGACHKALALDGVDMQQLGAVHVLDDSQSAHQLYDIVSVGRSEVADVHAFEDVLLAGDDALQRIVEADDALLAVFVHPTPRHHLSGSAVAPAVIGGVGVKL